MNFKTVALLHPGNMGATIGAAAATSGARVIWVSHQRSQATQERAKRAGLVDVKNLTDAVRESEVILSVCPPDAALELARKVAEHNFKGIYVDANAVSRATAEEIGRTVTKGGASFVDGASLGRPSNKRERPGFISRGAAHRKWQSSFLQACSTPGPLVQTPVPPPHLRSSTRPGLNAPTD